MMAGSTAIWLLCMLGAGMLYIFRPGGVTAALAASAVLLPLLSALAAFAGSRRITARLNVPDACESGTPAELGLELKNRGLLPFLRVRADIGAENMLTGEVLELRQSAALMGRDSLGVKLELRSKYCGAIHLSLRRLRVYDLFGIFRFRVRCADSGTLLVVPAVFDIRLIYPEATSSAADSDEYSQLRPGRDPSEVFQIRDYAEGDSPRQIHWKLSTKYERLVVKDPGLPLERYVLMMWERGNPDESAEQTDALLRVLVSVCRALTQQSIGCRLIWPEQASELCADHTVRSEEELYELLPKLLEAGSCNGSVVERFLRQYGPEKEKRVLYLSSMSSDALAELCPDGRLTALMCGCTGPVPGRAISFSAENAAEALFELDLS